MERKNSATLINYANEYKTIATVLSCNRTKVHASRY